MKIETDRTNARVIVLVVEDDDLCRVSFQAMLEHIGFEVVAVSNGASALQTFAQKTGDIAIVLLDVVLPGMSGLETFQCLRDINDSLPIVLTSGHSRDVIISEFQGLDYDGFVAKPASFERFRNIFLKAAG